MPNLKTATQPVDTSQMTMVPPPSPTMRPPLGQISADPEFSPLSLAPTPSVMSTQVDASRQFYRQSVSQVRMPPLQPSSSVAVGSQIQSHITAAANDSGSSVNPTFEVNNVENPVQNILNITGAGVSYGPGAGEVQISSAVVTTITAGGTSLASGAIGEATLVSRPPSRSSAWRATVPCAYVFIHPPRRRRRISAGRTPFRPPLARIMESSAISICSPAASTRCGRFRRSRQERIKRLRKRRTATAQ